MIIYLCIKFESNTLIFSKDIERKPFFKVENFSKFKMGHNSKNNWWIITLIEWKPSVVRTGRTGRAGGTGGTDVRTDSGDTIGPLH